MAIFTLYGDASGTRLSADVLTMSGFIATAEQWVRLERRWESILKMNKVSSLHMKNFAHSQKDFQSWKDDKQRRARFLGDLIDEIALRARASFATGVFMPDYQKVDEKYGLKELVSPLALAGCTLITKVYTWAELHGVPRDRVRFVFEDGDLDKGNFSDICHQVWKMRPRFESKDGCRVLETADLLSYEFALACKKIQNSEEKLFFDDFRAPFKRLASIPNAKGKYWNVFENPLLEQRCRDLLDNRA